MNPREFINTIVLDILESEVSSNKLFKMGGSKNTLWQCADRNTCIGNKPVIVLANLITSEIKYNNSKKEKVLNYIKQFLNDDELIYIEKYKDDIRTLVRIMAEKINNRKCEKMLPDFNKLKTKKIVNMYDVTDSKEKQRLEFQKILTRNEDLKVLEPILENKKNINILDIGCNNGNLVIDRIESLKITINKLIGIDSNKEIVGEANEINGSDIYHFYCENAEKDSFDENIKNIMDDNQIEGFDLICLSMVLLHLSKPYHVLKKLRKIMNKGSIIFIRDMDDTLAMIYPDQDNLFEKSMKISNDIEMAGFRNFGRQIPSLLKKSGFNNISLHPESINTLGMNHDEKEALFNTNFLFILIDLPILIKKYPDEKKYSEYYKWITSVYDQMEELFQSDDFFYQMGTVLFTAEK
jgi:2-polyprenyl-3-methyl-5-hydroxy-6-metoxy-1,4-benzoquinol methylase